MRKNLFSILAICAALSGTAPLAFGHDHDSKDQGATSAAMGQKEMKSIRASQLIGSTVAAKAGESLGQVQDLIIDPKSGKIQFALVGEGFMAGQGETVIPVPWQAINVSAERKFVLNVDKNKLASAPTWGQSDSEQPDYVIRVYRFYAIPDPEAVGTPGAGEEQSGQGQGSSSDQLGTDGQINQQDQLEQQNQQPSPE